MADKRLLGNVALPDLARLIYNLDSEGPAIRIVNKNDHRVFEVLIDSETIKINSEGNLYLPLDNQTVFVDSETGLIKAAGLMVEAGDAIQIEDSEVEGVKLATINVMFDSETIVLDSEGKLTVPIDRQTIVINDLGQLVAVPEPLKDGVATHVHFGTSEWDSEAIDVLYDSETLRVDSENRLYVPIDKELVVVNSEGLISLAIDNKTIIYEDSEIKTRIGGWREDPVDTELFNLSAATLPADGVIVIEGYDVKPEAGTVVEVVSSLDLAGVPITETVNFTLADSADDAWLEAFSASNQIIDGIRFKKDFTEAQLIIDPAKVAAGAVDLQTRGHAEVYVYHKVNGIYLPTDNKTIYVSDNAEHELKVMYRVDEKRGLSVDSSEERIFVKVDGVSIGFDSEGRLTGTKKLEAIMPILITSEGDTSEGEGKIKLNYVLPLITNSEDFLALKLDEETVVLNSEGAVHAKIDYDTLIINSEGFIAVDRLTVPEVDAI